MKNRFFLLVLAAMTSLSLLAAEEIEIGALRYAINDSTRSAAVVAINRNDSIGSGVIIPDSIYYHDTAYPVTEIQQNAFAGSRYYDWITIPKTISRIVINDNYSFGYSHFDTIRFSGTLSDWLTKEWDPYRVSNDYALCIGSELLTSLVIPEGTDTIKANAFRGCKSFTSATIPASVRYIGEDAFRGITNINYHGNLQSYNNWGAHWMNAYVEGYFVYRNDSMTTLVEYLSDAPYIVTIPDGVIRIEESTFYGVYPYSVTVPNSVVYIEDSTFVYIRNIEYHGTAKGCPWGADNMNCYVEDDLFYKDKTKKELIFCAANDTDSVRIPNSVTKIRPFAFDECKNIGVLYLGNGMRKIGKETFLFCYGIDSVILSDGVKYIEEEAFDDVRVIVLGSSVKRLGENWIGRDIGKIYSYARSVPKAKYRKDDHNEYWKIQLYIPKDMERKYWRSKYWRQFDIHTMDTTLISEKRRSKFDFVKTCDGVGLISLATSDTLFVRNTCISAIQTTIL